MDLQELTGRESGAVIWREAVEGYITNWVGISGIPRLFVGQPVGMGDGKDIVAVSEDDIETDVLDLALELATQQNIADGCDDTSAEIDGIWANDEVAVITFKGWI